MHLIGNRCRPAEWACATPKGKLASACVETAVMRVTEQNNAESKVAVRLLRLPLLCFVALSAFPASGFSPIAEPTCVPQSGSEAGYIFRLMASPQGSNVRYVRYSSADVEKINAEDVVATVTLANCASGQAVAFDVSDGQADVDQVGFKQLLELIGEDRGDENIVMHAKALGLVVRSETIAEDTCVCTLLREGKLAEN